MALWALGSKALAAAGLAAAMVPVVALAEKEKDEKRKEDNSRPLFDPDALERGAKALREINKSPYAKQVLILIQKYSPRVVLSCKYCS